MSSTAPGSSSSSSGPHPIWLLILCGGGLIFWLMVCSSQIQATEHIINHQTGISPTLDTLSQWNTVWSGNVSVKNQAAFVVGWGIEILVLFLVTAYEVLKQALRHAHPLAIKLCGFALFAAWIVDAATDYSNFAGLPTGWRIICSLLEAAIVAFLGVGCINGLFYAWKHW